MAITCASCLAENEPDAESCFTCGRSLVGLTQGSVIAGRYEILQVLGRGGMGVVYKAHDRLLEENVAIKVLRSEYVNAPGMAARFRSEIKLARRVSHQNVCRIHEYGEDGPVCYISMALLEGIDLRDVVAQNPHGLPPDEAFELALQVTAGLKAIHDVGIVHRDLKTSNLLRAPDGIVYLMDFGIAKQTQTGATGLTATGEVMGTPEYMSPEQCRGDPLDVRSDLYSLGIVIYELFSGEVPFRGTSLMATLFKQIQEPVPFDGPVGSRLPGSLVPVLRRALAKNPAARPADANEMLEELRAARERASSRPSEPPALQPVPTVALPPTEERRRDSRLTLHVDLILRRIDPTGKVLEQERTVADNVSRHGMRVRTGMSGVSPGDLVLLQETDGDFQATARVRSVYQASDGIRRLGLEFTDQEAPERMVPHDEPRRTPAAKGVRGDLSSPLPVPPKPWPPERERRRFDRLAMAVDVMLRRQGVSGRVQEERSIADNIGRGGARVMTALRDLSVGDMVEIEEIEGGFKTRAAVRNTYVGPDRIMRLGLEFMDAPAPDRLVLTDSARANTPRAVPAAARPPSASHARVAQAPAGAATPERADSRSRREQILDLYRRLSGLNHYEVLGLPRSIQAAQVDQAYVSLSKLYHPDASTEDRSIADLHDKLRVIYGRIGQAYDVLRDPVSRAHYERSLPSDASPQTTAPSTPPSSPAAAPGASAVGGTLPRDPERKEPAAETRTASQEAALREGRRLFDEARYWDAIQVLEPAIDAARGTRLAHALQILLAQAVSKNPQWLKRAEDILRQVLSEAPRNIEARVLLGSVYRQAGLKKRARAELSRVLAQDPGHKLASHELAQLGPADPDEPTR